MTTETKSVEKAPAGRYGKEEAGVSVAVGGTGEGRWWVKIGFVSSPCGGAD